MATIGSLDGAGEEQVLKGPKLEEESSGACRRRTRGRLRSRARGLPHQPVGALLLLARSSRRHLRRRGCSLVVELRPTRAEREKEDDEGEREKEDDEGGRELLPR
jgi:hypothetical protein